MKYSQYNQIPSITVRPNAHGTFIPKNFTLTHFTSIHFTSLMKYEVLHTYTPMKMEQTGCSETLAFKLQMQGKTQMKAYGNQNTAKV
jgi:hypothetical protein